MGDQLETQPTAGAASGSTSAWETQPPVENAAEGGVVGKTWHGRGTGTPLKPPRECCFSSGPIGGALSAGVQAIPKVRSSTHLKSMFEQSTVHAGEVVSVDRNDLTPDVLSDVDHIDRSTLAHILGECIDCETKIKYLKIRFVDGEVAYVCEGAVSRPS